MELIVCVQQHILCRSQCTLFNIADEHCYWYRSSPLKRLRHIFDLHNVDRLIFFCVRVLGLVFESRCERKIYMPLRKCNRISPLFFSNLHKIILCLFTFRQCLRSNTQWHGEGRQPGERHARGWAHRRKLMIGAHGVVSSVILTATACLTSHGYAPFTFKSKRLV